MVNDDAGIPGITGGSQPTDAGQGVGGLSSYPDTRDRRYRLRHMLPTVSETGTVTRPEAGDAASEGPQNGSGNASSVLGPSEQRRGAERSCRRARQ